MSNEMKLYISGKEIYIESARLVKTMDTGADAFTCVMPWFPGQDKKLDDLTKPYGYQECKVQIDGADVMEGILYSMTHKRDKTGTVKEFEIYSKTKDVVDSSVRFPFEQNNVNLVERCESQMNSTVEDRGFDIEVIVDPDVTALDIGAKFPRIDVEQTDMCFEQLQKLAAQRGLLISNTIDGNLYITKPKIKGVPVGTLYESLSFEPNEWEIKFDGMKRFKYYEAIATSNRKGTTKKKQRATDLVVTRPRFLTFNAPDSLPGGAQNAAIFKKNISAAESLSVPFPINTWYAPDGNLFAPNTLISIVSPTMGINEGYTFLITKVEFIFTKDGATTQLEIIPPSMYSTGEIDEPWQN